VSGNRILYGPWLAWALLLGLPLLFWPAVGDVYGAIRWAALGAVATVLWLGSWPHRREIVAAVDPLVLLAMLTFTLIGLLGCVTALHPQEAFWDVARWAMALGLALQMVYGIARNPSLEQALWRAGTVAGLLLSTLRLLQYAGIVGGIPADGDPTAATLGNPNFFAGAMAMLAAMSCGNALRSRGLWRGLGWTACILCVVLTVLGKSNGAILALGAMVVVMLEGSWVILRPQSGYARRKGLRIALGLATLVTGMLALVWVMTRGDAGIAVQPDSTMERVLLWRQSFKMLQDAPILGVGAGHWHYHILKWGTVSNYQGFATRYFMEAHNDFIQQFAERGVLGGSAFLGMVGLAWVRGARYAGQAPRDWGRLAAWGGLTAWMVFACTNLPAEQPYLLLLLLVFMALLSGKHDLTSSTDRQPLPSPQAASTAPGRGRWIAVAATATYGLFALAAVGTLYLQVQWLKADAQNFEVLLAKGRQDWPRTARLAARAAAWYNPHDRLSGTPLVWYEGIALLSQGNAAAALPLLQAAKLQHPWHPQVLSNLGAAYYMVGDKEAAVLELEELLVRFPAFGDARINLAEIYLTLGNVAHAAATVACWKSPTGNPQYDGYYAKVAALLAGD
jgi:O-antigen ligase/Flp pilus assembly protein TadD